MQTQKKRMGPVVGFIIALFIRMFIRFIIRLVLENREAPLYRVVR